jgi:hypothetical protein
MKKIALLAIALIYAVSPMTTSALMGQQYDFFSENDIRYYDPDASGSCGRVAGSDGAPTTLMGDSNEQKVWNYFHARGLTDIAVAGIMGNFNNESAFDPARKQKASGVDMTTVVFKDTIADGGQETGGGGYGLAQWTYYTRRNALFEKIREAGLQQYYGTGWGELTTDATIPIDDLNKLLLVELDFAWEGDSTKIRDLAPDLNATTSVEGDSGSTVLFHNRYENSADDATKIQGRIQAAQAKYNQYSGGTECFISDGGLTLEQTKKLMEWWRDHRTQLQDEYHFAINYVCSAKHQCFAFAAFVYVLLLDSTPVLTTGGVGNQGIIDKLDKNYSDFWRKSTKADLQPFSIFASDGHIGAIVAVNGNTLLVAETSGTTCNDDIKNAHLGNGANLAYYEVEKENFNLNGDYIFASPKNPQEAIQRAMTYMQENGIL